MKNETFVIEVVPKAFEEEAEEYIVDQSGLEAFNTTMVSDSQFAVIPTVYGLTVWVSKDTIKDASACIDESNVDEDIQLQGESKSTTEMGSSAAA